MPASKPPANVKAPAPTARAFTTRLMALQSDDELRKIQRYFKSGEGNYGESDRFIGARMGSIFALAREFVSLPPKELETLLESDIHELRVGALSIMAKQYGLKTTDEARRKQLFELYLRRHDCINNWDLVDLAAWHVVGAWLTDKPRKILYRLAKSKSLWERRTAILATFAFIKRGELDDTFAIAEMLLTDGEDLIHKAVGGMLRAAGGKDPKALTAFLERHATTMPRTMLRYAIEHYAATERQRWLAKQ
ncbi:MAG: DNA alkylation repair protein [Devosia sp.]